MDCWKRLEIESPDTGYSEQLGPEVTDCDILVPLHLGFCTFVNPGKARQGVISRGFLEYLPQLFLSQFPLLVDRVLLSAAR